MDSRCMAVCGGIAKLRLLLERQERSGRLTVATARSIVAALCCRRMQIRARLPAPIRRMTLSRVRRSGITNLVGVHDSRLSLVRRVWLGRDDAGARRAVAVAVGLELVGHLIVATLAARAPFFVSEIHAMHDRG